MERIAKRERWKYCDVIEGMLNAYCATPHPATGKSLYELMFGRKMRLGVLPENDSEVRQNNAFYKLKSKRYQEVFKIVCERDPVSRDNKEYERKQRLKIIQQQHLKTIYLTGGELIRIHEMQGWTRSMVIKQKIN